MKALIFRLNLKTGIALAIVFPGIFTFAQPSTSSRDIIIRFLNFFIFILVAWVLAYSIVDFKPILRKRNGVTRRRLYRNIFLTSAASSPLYIIISWMFNSDNITLAYAFNNNFSAKGWFFIILRIILFNAGILITKYLYDNSIEQRKILLENEELKREHINAVHESLKQQVDPHFLFNSLNTLQSLVKQDSTQALHFISELAQVYRYMLHRRDNRYVTLKDEIDFLRSYLYLLKIRFGDAIVTQIEVDDLYLTSLIPPHTLQLLAENTVKHNKLSARNPLRIRIYTESSQLIVSNNLSEKTNEAAISCVGLKNINSRYNLLFGKEIAIKKEEQLFNVYLPIINNNESTDYRR